jgi:Protein of unknown function (DUF3106)
MTDMAKRRCHCSLAWRIALSALLCACFSLTQAQTSTPPAAATAAPSASQNWQQLTPRQKQALAPLGAQWGALTPQQQSKWLAISQNFLQMSVAEQVTMHARMTDWVALSPQQRNLARFNFNTVQNLPKEDKKAKWEAYQALSAEEKRQLSAGALAPAKSAAPTARPVESHRLVQTPLRVTKTPHDAPPRPAAPDIDRKTLLPRPQAVTTPAPTAPASDAAPPDTTHSATETSPS